MLASVPSKFARSFFGRLVCLPLCCLGLAVPALVNERFPATWAVAAGTSEDEVSKVENRLFFRQYDDENIDTRLARIEKQIFGSSFPGSAAERLARIGGSLPPEKPRPVPVAPLPEPVPPARANQAASPDEDDAAEKEGARAAAVAARDEEVTKLLQEGVEAYRSKNFAKALDRFQQVIRLDPQNAQAHYSLGIAMEAKGEFLQALRCYERAAELDPANRDYAQAVKTVKRKASTEKGEIRQDESERTLAEQAAQAYRAEEYLSALDLYKQLDEKQPNNALTKFNIATVYLALKRPMSALDYYRAACKLKPNEPKYTNALQMLEASVRKDETEREKSEKAIEASQPKKSSPKTASPKDAGDPLIVFGLKVKGSKDGLKVLQLDPQLRASQVGLKQGDIIKAVDGAVVTSVEKMRQVILSKPLNARFQFTVQRNERLGQITF